MAHVYLPNAEASALADLLSDHLDNGYLRIYSGTEPATADAALSGNTLLAELRLANPASGAAVNGVLTLNAITGDAAADATGTATFFRAFKSDGTTLVLQGDVSTSGAALVFASVAFQAGVAVDVTSFVLTVPRS